MINLISDTVTRPTPGMLQAMMQAEVGDDVFKHDPTVNLLEAKVAEMFGMEAALFFPSGTMANQTAIKIHTQPGEQLICDKWAHVFNYEGGGASFNSGVSCRLVDGHRGMMKADQVEALINPPDFYHSPLTTLVTVENTTNRGGGACWDFTEILKIREVCDRHGLAYHLDGARLWNAMLETPQQPKDYGKVFDTISVCLSKGLGAPVGSVLVGTKKHMEKALRIRKVFGGGMRQAGYLAAAGIYAIDHQWKRMKADHAKAKELNTALQQLSQVESVEETATNIVIFQLKPSVEIQVFVQKLNEKGILISNMGQGKLRMVTHLDYTDEMHEKVLDVLDKLKT